MLAFCLQILLQIKGRVPEIPEQALLWALPSGRQQENVPDGFWEGEPGFWHGHSSLQGDSRSHTGESSRGSVGVQVCPSESSASAWDISCPKEQESRWQLDATNHRDRSPGRTQSDTGSPRLGGKGRLRDRGLTLSVSTALMFLNRFKILSKLEDSVYWGKRRRCLCKTAHQPVTNMSSGGFHSITFNQSPTSLWADVHPQSPSPGSHFPPVKGLDMLG